MTVDPPFFLLSCAIELITIRKCDVPLRFCFLGLFGGDRAGLIRWSRSLPLASGCRSRADTKVCNIDRAQPRTRQRVPALQLMFDRRLSLRRYCHASPIAALGPPRKICSNVEREKYSKVTRDDAIDGTRLHDDGIAMTVLVQQTPRGALSDSGRRWSIRHRHFRCSLLGCRSASLLQYVLDEELASLFVSSHFRSNLTL